MYYSKPEIIFADFDRGRNVAGIGARRRTMSLSAAPVGQRWYCLRGAQAPGDSGRVGPRATNASRGPVATFCSRYARGLRPERVCAWGWGPTRLREVGDGRQGQMRASGLQLHGGKG